MKRTELVSDVRPKVGDVVTFEYDSFSRSSSSSIPIAPKISRIRTDLSWESVLFEAYRSQALLNGMTCATFEQQVNMFPESSTKAFKLPLAQERLSKGKIRRTILEKFARSRNFDPLVAENWYTVSRRDIQAFKVCKRDDHYDSAN